MIDGARKNKWFYTLPYFLICIFFLVLPLVALISDCISGGFSGFVSVIQSASYRTGFRNSFLLAVLVTVESTIFGALVALHWEKKSKTNSFITAILNFGANNGGVTLAFALIATIGSNGLITNILDAVGINVLDDFQVASFAGLNLAYVGFMTPYMAIIFMPSISNIKADWYRAAMTLGASRGYYLKTVGIPVIMPSFMSCACLVFLNAMGLYALPASISEQSKLITLQIGMTMSSSIFQKNDSSYLSMILVIFMVIVVFIYQKTKKQAERWMK